jgi:hypothetical protein
VEVHPMNIQYILIYQKSLNNVNAIRDDEEQIMQKKNRQSPIHLQKINHLAAAK